MINMASHIVIIFIRVVNRIVNLTAHRKRRKTKIGDISLSNSYYLMAAKQLDISAIVFDNHIIQFRKGEKVQNIWSAWTDLDGEASLMIAGDKPLCYALLAEENLPVPNYKVLKRGDYIGAIQFKRKCNAPVVIKPARNTGDAAGVFVKVKSNFEIWWAVCIAGALSDEIIVEEYYEGINCRLLFCKGRFLAASSRIPRYVVADGTSTVENLIAKENGSRIPIGEYYTFDERKRPIRYRIPLDRETKKVLKDNKHTLKSIPSKGEKVPLQRICHWYYGGEYYDVSSDIPSQLVKISEKAVSKLGIKLAGIDLIMKDIENVTDGSFVINEINTTPALLVHYEVQNQDKMRPVAIDILKTMFNM